MAIDGCRDRSQIPSASYFDPDGTFRYNNKIGRMKDAELAETDSPFTNGVFDRLMAAYPDQRWISMYETDRGRVSLPASASAALAMLTAPLVDRSTK